MRRARLAELPEPDERRRIRKEAGARVEDLADIIGVHPWTVLRWETGKNKPRLEDRLAYAKVLRQLERAISR
ncbi:MAG: helix-turn-helix transcriptional regulator [Actinomycetota bacterium]